MTASAWAPCLLLVGLALVSGCAAPETSRGSDGTVQARDDVFVPAALSGAAATPVEWENVGRNFHTVTVQKPGAPPRTYLFDQEIQPRQTATFSFPEAGTYDVFCRYHSQGAAGDFASGMVMKVTVT